MFFSNEILTKKGGQFAVVWLVGNFNTVHGSKRLGLKKSDYVSVDVVKACGDMLNPRTQFALRLSSTLLMGIIRVYEKQISIVYEQVKSMWVVLKQGSFMHPQSVDLPSQRSETFALPNPLYHYDKEMGNEQSDIRFYTSLGEKALLEGHGVKQTHESRDDSAYFTISLADHDIETTVYDESLIAEESPAKRRKITKDSFLDIIEGPHTPLKMMEKSKMMPIQVPDEQELEPQIESDLLNLSEEQLNVKFAECSQLQVSHFGEVTSDTVLLGDESEFQEQTDIQKTVDTYNVEETDRHKTDAIEDIEEPLQNIQISELQDSMLENAVQLLPIGAETPFRDSLLNNESDLFGAEQSMVDNTTIRSDVDPVSGIQDMLIDEISSRIESDRYIQELNKENVEPVNLQLKEKENVAKNIDKSSDDNAKTSVENVENEDRNVDNEQTLIDEDKENRNPNLPLRRSQREAKKPLRPAQDKAFDDSIGGFVLDAAPTPPTGPSKRRKKRHLILDKTSQITVKEMKRFMKNSRQALCTDPALIHKIRPSPEELFSEPHRPYLKRVPELSNLWQKCAYGGDHDLTEVLQRQEQINKEQDDQSLNGIESREEQASRDDQVSRDEQSRKRPRSSVMSDVEIGRFGGNSTLQDISEADSTRRDSTGNISEDLFIADGFRTSTVLKPIRGSGLSGPVLSPILQLDNLEESDIYLEPQELLPIMEETSMLQDGLEDHPEIPQLPEIPELSTDLFPTSTMFGQDSAHDLEVTDRTTAPMLETLQESLLSPERPGTPLIERLSGLPQEDTVNEQMSAFKYFPDRESQKFYRFVEKNFSSNQDSINFEDLVPTSHTRKTAALAFYQLLLLKKFSHVKVDQEDDVYYGRISIELNK